MFATNSCCGPSARSEYFPGEGNSRLNEWSLFSHISFVPAVRVVVVFLKSWDLLVRKRGCGVPAASLWAGVRGEPSCCPHSGPERLMTACEPLALRGGQETGRISFTSTEGNR